MQPLDFPLVGGWPVAGGLERPRRLVLKLLLPGVYLVGVHLITLGQVGHRRLLSQRLQRNLRFQRRIDPSSCPLSHRPLRLIRNGAFSNYAPGPIFRVHFTPRILAGTSLPGGRLRTQRIGRRPRRFGASPDEYEVAWRAEPTTTLLCA